MKFILLLAIFFQQNTCFAKDEKSLYISSDLTPIFHIVIEHLKQQEKLHLIKSDLLKIKNSFQYITSIEDLNELINLEVHKIVLNTNLEKNKVRRSIKVQDIKKAKDELKLKIKNLSRFSILTLSKSIEDFTDFLNKNQLEIYQENKTSSKLSAMVKIRIQKHLKYSGPWLHIILNDTPTEINNLFTNIARQFISNLAEQLNVLRLHSFPPTPTPSPLISGLETLTKKTKSEIRNQSSASPPTNPLELLKDIPSKSRKDSIDELLKQLPPAQ